MKRKFTIYNPSTSLRTGFQFSIKFVWPGLFIALFFILYSLFSYQSAFALQSCLIQNPNPRVTQGLITTPSFPATGNKFGNPAGTCVVDPKAPFTKILTYAELKSLYYTQSKATKTDATPVSGTANQGTLRSALNNYDVVLIRGDLTINSSLGGSPKPAVVFVDGNLSFNSAAFTFGDSNSGLVFVVGRDVTVDQSVTRIDAVIISSGTIYTASTAGVSCNTSSITTTSPLTINGSLISLDAGKVIFCRTLNNNNNPAEVINQQPKYLVILRNLMSDTKQKWSEIQ